MVIKNDCEDYIPLPATGPVASPGAGKGAGVSNLVKNSDAFLKIGTEKKIEMTIQKCTCKSSWCPSCYERYVVPKIQERLKAMNWKRVRQITVTVDRQYAENPAIALSYFNAGEFVAAITRGKRKKQGLVWRHFYEYPPIKWLDYVWWLEFHVDGTPHWHLFIEVEESGSAAMIGGDRLRHYWPWGRITESYIKSEKHWEKIVGYELKKGYAGKDKSFQSRLPEILDQSERQKIRRWGHSQKRGEQNQHKREKKQKTEDDCFRECMDYFDEQKTVPDKYCSMVHAVHMSVLDCLAKNQIYPCNGKNGAGHFLKSLCNEKFYEENGYYDAEHFINTSAFKDSSDEDFVVSRIWENFERSFLKYLYKNKKYLKEEAAELAVEGICKFILSWPSSIDTIESGINLKELITPTIHNLISKNRSHQKKRTYKEILENCGSQSFVTISESTENESNSFRCLINIPYKELKKLFAGTYIEGIGYRAIISMSDCASITPHIVKVLDIVHRGKGFCKDYIQRRSEFIDRVILLTNKSFRFSLLEKEEIKALGDYLCSPC